MLRAVGFLAVIGFFVMGMTACSSQTPIIAEPPKAVSEAEPSEDDWLAAPAVSAWPAAEVEPALSFPARIGLARIDGGYMTPVPAAEAEAWATVAKSLGPGYGDLVPISPLVVALANSNPAVCTDCARQPRRAADLAKTVSDIRVGAARQRVDAVLVYETFARSDLAEGPAADDRATLVGAVLAPRAGGKADGYAQAVLLDVRNGYTYGTAQASAEDAGYSLTISVDTDVRGLSAQEQAKSAAAVELAKDVEQLVRSLRRSLAERRAGQTALHMQ